MCPFKQAMDANWLCVQTTFQTMHAESVSHTKLQSSDLQPHREMSRTISKKGSTQEPNMMLNFVTTEWKPLAEMSEVFVNMVEETKSLLRN